MSSYNYSLILFLLFNSITAYSGPQIVKTNEAISAINSQIKNLDILLVGDTDHENPILWESFSLSLENLKTSTPTLDCAFLEVDKRIQPAFVAFTNSSDSKFSKILEKFPNDALPSKNIGATEKILLNAKKLGLKVIAGDIDFSSELGQKLRMETLILQLFPNNTANAKAAVSDIIEERSRLFAVSIDKALKEGTCHKVVAMIGASHLTDTMAGLPIKPLQSILNEQGHKYTTSLIWPIKCDSDEEKKQGCDKLKEIVRTNSYSMLYNAQASGFDVSFLLLAP